MNKTTTKLSLVPIERIERAILLIRGQKIMIDADLATLYGTTTKRLNEQVRRNINRFPYDFMFRLTPAEKAEVVANCDHLAKLKYSKTSPRAFTEYGALMAATVLNSPRAQAMSLLIIRTFVRLRQLLANDAELSRRLDDLERKYDKQFRVVFDAIRELMIPQERPSKPPIGYHSEKNKS